MYDNSGNNGSFSSQPTESFENQSTDSSKEGKKTHNKKGNSKLSMFFSGIAGGLLVALSGAIFISADAFETNLAGNNVNPPAATESNIQSAPVTEEESSIATAIESSAAAVVGIANLQKSNRMPEAQEAGTGSGVIYKVENEKAYVVTNNHVVEGASSVEVILQDGKRVNATVLGKDELSDLAVLEMDSKNVTQVAQLGSSNSLDIGDTAIAIGNPLGLEFAGSVTKGIISGLERSVKVDLNRDGTPDWTTEVIQTDAAINPGNSGGALVNANGEVIGINSMKIAKASVEGIGFAIPIDYAKPIIDQLETKGEVSRPFIGIAAIGLANIPAQQQAAFQLPEDVKGIFIAKVEENSPAGEAGLRKNDVITHVNGEPLSDMLELKQYLYKETEIGEEITVDFYRSGKKQSTTLVLSEQ